MKNIQRRFIMNFKKWFKTTFEFSNNDINSVLLYQIIFLLRKGFYLYAFMDKK